ncbi:putative membrane protein [Priestia megaterium]|jgi:hypothetical protein|nr:putative membrane protein [Priestia megaterium]
MFAHMSGGLRVCLFIVGIALKVTAVLTLIFEMNLAPIHGRSLTYYAEAIGMKLPIICFVLGFFCVAASFYLPAKNRRTSK